MSNVTPVLTFANVQSIGRAEVKRDNLALSVAESMPLDYDWTARGAVAEAIRRAGGWTKETCPARKSGGKDNQTVTVFGVGFSALESAVTRIVKAPKDAEPGVIRLSLSGEGGQTLTLREGDEHYAAALAILASTVEA